ncbi:protoheme IX farnesyltransferase [Candidatus Nanopelagicus limnes]|uniref:Protoheme IX farnesyltransferase n=1 Tax=Candidatus Nanopelagicus limnae TaxID=1884634 RepID=A0A249JWD2_9ACTN|nr:heme o synthase [Candidatus Nanopelagicus limnes]ASY08833.2 protoheme IX farnesyltransferase [Candidatus Nanopelagicus limnes]
MKNYISLMKLRVVELLLVTTLPALFLASEGVPDLSITFWSLLGGTFAAGGANAYNMIIEAKSDLLMKRTAKRPIATGEISRNNGLVFATLISLISLAIFYIFTTPLATLLTFLAITFYVFGYTIALKKHTSQNIVWGGIAGCMPVLIGQAAVTNSLTNTSWLFFLLIFFWTPPHFWALAVRYKDDYKAAGIPMLPVVAPIKSVINQMWFHSLAMVAFSLLVIWSAKLPIWLSVITLLLIAGWKRQLIKLTKEPSEVNAGKLFQASIVFLSIYSFLLVIGVLLK